MAVKVAGVVLLTIIGGCFLGVRLYTIFDKDRH